MVDGIVAVVLQSGAIADLGIENLASGESFKILNEIENFEWHLIVGAPRHIAEGVVDDDGHGVDVLFEHRRRVYGERCSGIVAWQRLYGIKIDVV
jgi:hypothetical protein